MKGHVTGQAGPRRHLVWLLTPWLTLGAGCATGHRGLETPCAQDEVTQQAFHEDGEEPTTIIGWEERQIQHAEALAMAAGRQARIPRQEPEDPGSPDAAPQPAEPVRPAPQRPADTHFEPSSGQGRPSQPAPAVQGSPDVRTSKDRGDMERRSSRRSHRTARYRADLRCQRICRHVKAICQAAGRICALARRLGDPESLQACRRAEARCADARSIAEKTCHFCPNQ